MCNSIEKFDQKQWKIVQTKNTLEIASFLMFKCLNEDTLFVFGGWENKKLLKSVLQVKYDFSKNKDKSDIFKIQEKDDKILML